MHAKLFLALAVVFTLSSLSALACDGSKGKGKGKGGHETQGQPVSQ